MTNYTIGLSGCDFTDWGTMVNALIGNVTEATLVTLVDDITNITPVSSGAVQIANGALLDINLNGHVITSKVAVALDRHWGASTLNSCGTLTIRNGKISAAPDMSGDTLFYLASLLNPYYISYLNLYDLFVDTSQYAGGQSTLFSMVLGGNVQGSFYQNVNMSLQVRNILIAAKAGASNGVGLLLSCSGTPNFPDYSRLRLFENCSIFSIPGADITAFQASFANSAYCSIKNCVAWGESGGANNWSLWNNPALYTIENCADSDGSLAIGQNNVTGITAADFVSVDPASENFLKNLKGGKLYKTGSTDISSWNTTTYDGSARPDIHTLKVDIGARDAASLPLPAGIDGLFEGAHEYVDPDNEAHLFVKKGRNVWELLADGTKVVRDDTLNSERIHFFTHRGRCRYYGPTTMRKITRTTAERVGIEAPESDQMPAIVLLGGTPGGTVNGHPVVSGDWAYKYTYVIEDADGNLLWESNPSAAAEATLVNNIAAMKCSASPDSRVNARYIYRTTSGGAVYGYIGRIQDNNPDTVFYDYVSDAEIGRVLELTHGVPAQSYIAEGANERQFFLSGHYLRWSENAYTESYLEYQHASGFKELPYDGQGTGLKRLYNTQAGRDDLFIFQKGSFHVLPGADPLRPIVTVSSTKGCVQQDTIVEYNGGLVFLTPDNKVVYYKGKTVDISSKVIPATMGKLLTPETATASLLYGHFYALCCRKTSSKFYNHFVILFDLDTIAQVKEGDERGFATCECWFWNIDAQYLIQRRDGSILAFDNNTLYVFAIEFSQRHDQNPDGSTSEIVAKFQTKYHTEGFYSRSQPVSIRVKGEQTGTIKITPYYLGNYRSTGSDGHSIPNIGTVFIAGRSIAGRGRLSEVQKHIETNFYQNKADECFSLAFEKAERDQFFKLSAYELIYRTRGRA